MRLQIKIVLALAVLLALSATASIVYVKLVFAEKLRGELEKRAISIARNLAQHSTSSLLARDRLALKMIANAQAKTEADIVYIFFVGPGGGVLAHTFGESFPNSLLAANPIPAGKEFSLRNLRAEEEDIYDVAMPAEAGGLGIVRVGLSATPVNSAVNQLSGQILLVTLLFGAGAILLSIPLSAGITRSVKKLTVAAEGVAEGDFEHHVPVLGSDEIGQLADRFNRMIDNLQAARHDLLERNNELAEEVSRRSNAETRLAAQLNLISILIDEIPTPVFFKDARGVYQGCNRAFEAFTGVSRAELCGRTVSEILPADEAPVHVKADTDLFETLGSCRYETFLTTRSGARREVILQKATYNTPDGKLAGMVGILIDITSEREVDRMRNDFVSTTAHEFQTPLTAILGFCDLLQADGNLPAEARNEYLDIIRERGEYLSRLVDRFLDVSRIDGEKPLPLDPHPYYPDFLLRQLLQGYKARESRHHFELHLPPHPPAIMVDEVRFIEVIENLLNNAMKYSPAGSPIRVDGRVEAGRFIVTVTDQGPGMTKEQCSRIFEKFYRIDSSNNAPSGTGLGLYISRAIIRAHGGELDVSSSPGNGSSFIIRIPLASPDAAPAPNAVAEEAME